MRSCSERQKKNHKFGFISGFMGIMLALLMISISFTSVVEPVRGETDWAIVGGGAAVGAASGALIGTAVADGPGALAGAIVGGVWGAIAGWMAQDKHEAVLSGAQLTYATALKNITANYLTIAQTDAQNEIVNYEAWTLYYARKAEWAALQLYQSQVANGTTPTYDAQYVLTKSEVANGTLAAAWHIAQTYEAILNSNKDLANSFVGTYEEMAWGYRVGTTGNYYVESKLTKNNPLVVKVLYQIDATYKNTKYGTFSAGEPIYFANCGSESYNDYNITITSRQGQVVYSELVSFPESAVKIVHLPVSGEYNVNIDGGNVRVYAMCAKAMTSSYGLTPTIIALTNSGDSVVINGKYGVYDVSEVWFNNPFDISIPLGQLKTDLASISSKVTTMLTQANNFAQVYFNTLVSNGGGENRVMPDIIFPDPDVLANMSAGELQATYLAYLRSVQSWFANYSVMNPNHVNLSLESLNLKVRGAIYHANGTLMFDNLTVFTPYVSLANMNLVIGNNTMTQPGFAIKWGSASSLADFMETGRFTDIKYIQLGVGDYFVIEEMMLDNEPVTEVPLTVHTIQYITVGEDDLNPITPPQIGASDIMDLLREYWYFIAIGVGAVLMLGGFASSKYIIVLIGFIIVVIGVSGWYLSTNELAGLLGGLLA